MQTILLYLSFTISILEMTFITLLIWNPYFDPAMDEWCITYKGQCKVRNKKRNQ